MKVVFKCETCRQVNKNLLGMEGFEPLQVVFSLFSDALIHWLKEPDHYIDAIIEKDEDEE